MKMKKSFKKNIITTLLIIFSFVLLRLFLADVMDSSLERGILRFSQANATTYHNSLSEVSIGSKGEVVDQRSLLLSDYTFRSLKSNTSLKTSDPRALAMRRFLQDYHSPLYPYSEIFVSEADKYGLDWRLVASISGVESAFGNLIPYRTNNGWGWKGGPGGNFSIFSSWKEGIEVVTSRLALGYGTNLSPFEIEPVYCPPCYANPAHAWANGVTRFMLELESYVNNLE